MVRSTMTMLSVILLASTGSKEVNGSKGGDLQPNLCVRIYDYAHTPTEVLVEARKAVDSIFRHAGVEISWWNHSFKSPLVTRVERNLEFQLRILNHDMAKRLPGSKIRSGLAFPGTGGQQGVVANVFYHRVEELAEWRTCSKGVILGHAAAHELGHLLLGTIQHTTTGIMKARLGYKELESAAKGDLLFSKEEASLIRRRLMP